MRLGLVGSRQAGSRTRPSIPFSSGAKETILYNRPISCQYARASMPRIQSLLRVQASGLMEKRYWSKMGMKITLHQQSVLDGVDFWYACGFFHIRDPPGVSRLIPKTFALRRKYMRCFELCPYSRACKQAAFARDHALSVVSNIVIKSTFMP